MGDLAAYTTVSKLAGVDRCARQVALEAREAVKLAGQPAPKSAAQLRAGILTEYVRARFGGQRHVDAVEASLGRRLAWVREALERDEPFVFDETLWKRPRDVDSILDGLEEDATTMLSMVSRNRHLMAIADDGGLNWTVRPGDLELAGIRGLRNGDVWVNPARRRVVSFRSGRTVEASHRHEVALVASTLYPRRLEELRAGPPELFASEPAYCEGVVVYPLLVAEAQVPPTEWTPALDWAIATAPRWAELRKAGEASGDLDELETAKDAASCRRCRHLKRGCPGVSR